MKCFPPKGPSEVVPLGINFRKWIELGEGVASCTFQAIDSITGDEAPGVLDTADPDVTAWPWARLRAVGGEEGKTYLIRVTVQTSKGKTLVAIVKLPICSYQ